jgi:segregation and condensation protein A
MLSPDVNVASEFFVMAATLTHIKSQMLLPKENQEEEDPRKPLVAKLLEYEQFKKASVQLDSRSWLGRDIFCRTEISVDDILPEETKLDAPIEAVDNFQLLLCLKIALDRSFRKPIEISADMTSIKEKVTHITGLLETSTSLNFAELMSPTPRINEVIVSFLAILELAKLKFIEIIQLENFGIIQIRPVRELREINYGLLDQY